MSEIGILYICPTPIGNLEDITLRTLRILKEADVIYCEDTRHSKPLLTHYDIRTLLVSYHKFNERARLEEIRSRIKEGEKIALISDAGMPGVSDPGEILIAYCIEENLPYTVLPGPSAHVTASVFGNFPGGRYIFFGFLPGKASERRRILVEYEEVALPVIFYEAPHKLIRTFQDMMDVLGNREILLMRELTKVYEERVSTTLKEFLNGPEKFTLKGEFVLALLPKVGEEEEIDIRAVLKEKIDQGYKKSQAVKLVAEEYNLPKNDVYRESLTL